MKKAVLVFPHQLFAEHPFEKEEEFILIEEYLFFRQLPFHKQKIAFHRSSMKAYADTLEIKGKRIRYISAMEPGADIRELAVILKTEQYNRVCVVDPTDEWLNRRIKKYFDENQIAVQWKESPLFLNTSDEIAHYFEGKKRLFQTEFYIHSRKKNGILLEADGCPIGGQWSFDADNRKRYPKDKFPPSVAFPDDSKYFQEAVLYTLQNFGSNPGKLSSRPFYPHDRAGALKWLHDFTVQRFAEFGPYEDAMVAGAQILHHSLLSPLINAGLLSPKEVLDKVLEYSARHPVPLASLEGFVRQVMGWREFIRAVYQLKGNRERTANYWGFTRKIPPAFWEGKTGIVPVDDCIEKLLQTGYCHHIERLMILGNFMLLCEFDPDEVYQWFMALFIDSYDWVMVPNVYGMSQFADGGLMSTKPYISGSNYLMKMSDYPKGEWQQIWDALYWRFIHTHRDFFLSNPRLGMMVKLWDKSDIAKQQQHLQKAETYLQQIN